YYSQRNSDGSWGSPVVMWRGSTQFGQGPVIGGASITGINKINQGLGWVQPDGNYAVPQPLLYDINSHTLLNMARYLSPQPPPHPDIRPIAIDEQGRILLQTGLGVSADHTVLLTPDGVSSDPIPLATPEPSSLAVMALAVAAFALHRAQEHRRRRA